MALCVRAIPNKILSFVGTISQTQLDRRLARLIGTSQFLHEAQCAPRKSSPELIIPSAYNAREYLNNFKKSTNEINLYAVASQLPKKSVDLPKQDEFSRENPEQSSNYGQPTSEALLKVYKTLQTDLPRFFVTTMDYRIYSREIEFINHIKGTATQGLNNYMKQILLLRVGGHLTYAYIKLEVLKITMHSEDSTIRVRWRIRGLSTYKAFFNFWKFKWLKSIGGIKSLESWYDGYSVFSVNAQGQIYRHVADKMMPDEEMTQDKGKPDIAAKLAA
ncbi:GSCOCG00000825001-RA-CDS [Cotesia congregata]|uniref:Similar to Uncharacterized protein C6orf136 homolog (Bos taurus) n=1 Tax=Cotesia congregata TaxID=51543 RepID=A0A8J2MPE3_COTCN|nr:GSCOCG00000825001-RA-CDS [Cotesia congregata]CAG5095565.1 Similar to Uncharacterized protein C6orf136 homolog (Bos taurus) [Cotesia congregata]